jgi:hypothetical protein
MPRVNLQASTRFLLLGLIFMLLRFAVVPAGGATVSGGGYFDGGGGFGEGADYSVFAALEPGAGSPGTARSTHYQGAHGVLAPLATTSPFAISQPVTGITGISATLGAVVASDNGETVTERGFVLSVAAENTDPRIDGSAVRRIALLGGGGSFSQIVGDLTPGTVYVFRAYAINAAGTGYSTPNQFTTLSNDARLSSLALTGLLISPEFNLGNRDYTLGVRNETAAVSVTASASHNGASLGARINGGKYVPLDSGSNSSPLALNIGSNSIEVRVVAEDGISDQIYSVAVERAKAVQTIDFSSIPDQLGVYPIILAASGGGSGNPVNFTVISGPGVISSGNILSFSGAGFVTISAAQEGDAAHDPTEAVSQTFEVVLPQPDIAVGTSLTQLRGVGVYGSLAGQTITLESRRARPRTGYVNLANRTALSDRRAAEPLAGMASPGNRLFRVRYLDPRGNVTAGLVSGNYQTPALDGDDADFWVLMNVIPNQRKLEIGRGRSAVTLRRTYRSSFRLQSTLNPATEDRGAIFLKTQ